MSLKVLSKIIMSVILMSALLYVVDTEILLRSIYSVSVPVMLSVILLVALQNIVGSLRRLGSHLPFKDIFSIYVIGSVANIIFLTSVGGISVRTVLLVRQGVRLMNVVVGLFIERIFVFAALLVTFFVGAYILKQNLNLQIIDTTVYFVFLFVFLIFALAVIAMLFLRFYKLEHGREVSRLFAVILKHPFTCSMLMTSSLFMLFLGFSAIGVIALGLGIDVPILLLLSVQPIIAVAASLPVSIGGWGVREGSMVLGLSLLHVSQEDALALSILYGMAGVIATLLLAGVTVLLGTGGDLIKKLDKVNKVNEQEGDPS